MIDFRDHESVRFAHVQGTDVPVFIDQDRGSEYWHWTKLYRLADESRVALFLPLLQKQNEIDAADVAVGPVYNWFDEDGALLDVPERAPIVGGHIGLLLGVGDVSDSQATKRATFERVDHVWDGVPQIALWNLKTEN